VIFAKMDGPLRGVKVPPSRAKCREKGKGIAKDAKLGYPLVQKSKEKGNSKFIRRDLVSPTPSREGVTRKFI